MLDSVCTWINDRYDSLASSTFAVEHDFLFMMVIMPLVGIILSLFGCLEDY